MALTLSLRSYTSQPHDQYRTPSYKPFIMKLIRFESPRLPPAGQTTISASCGSNRCLTAVRRRRLAPPIDCLSSMAMDLTSQWILLTIVTGTRSSSQYILLTQPTRCSLLTLPCLSLSQLRTQTRSQPLWRAELSTIKYICKYRSSSAPRLKSIKSNTALL